MFDSLFKQIAAIAVIDWLAMFSGIIGVYLSIKERLSAWPFFILCYSAYVYISLRSGYYAFGAMNAGFIFIAIYGWCKWSGIANPSKKANGVLKISRLPDRFWLLIFTFIAVCTITIGVLLSQMDAARLPFLDAFAVSNALVAQWMLSRKHIENWIFWIVSDIIYISLFLNDRLWPSVFLFGVFILLACKGWRDWQRSIMNHSIPTNPSK
jgi:nicotinamide mononucleotide transporter